MKKDKSVETQLIFFFISLATFSDWFNPSLGHYTKQTGGIM